MMAFALALPTWVSAVADAYRQTIPSAWIQTFRLMPAPIGVSCAAVGVLLLLFGGDRAFRAVAPPLGAAMAALWSTAFFERVGLSGLSTHTATVSAIVLATLGLLAPPVVIFVGLAMPSALLAGALVGPNDWLLSALPGFVFGGVLGLIFYRQLCVIVAAMLGSWMLWLGLFAALQNVSPAMVRLSNAPPLVLSIAACTALCGAVFQLFVRKTPELRAQIKLERAQKKKREQEERELQRRWSDASWRKKKRG